MKSHCCNAPTYFSGDGPVCTLCNRFTTRVPDTRAVHQRLQSAVVEAAKTWKGKRDDGDNEKWSVHYVAMCEAIDALIAFEAEHKIGESNEHVD